jgi:hypothetical protein
MIQSPVRWGVGVAGCALLAACSSSATPQQVVTVTATRTPTVTASPSATTSAPGTSTASAGSTHSPSQTGMTDLPGTCDTLLDDSSVFSAAGVKKLPGEDAFVVGKAEPDIHRLGYLNCRYGVTGKGAAAQPAIEIGVSLYATSEDAAQRITATVEDYSAHGASTSSTQVAGQQASVLTGGTGAGYDVPTLVVADGQRTVAVSIATSVTSAAKFAHPAAAVAKLALERTAE